jgi:hypothetical protein
MQDGQRQTKGIGSAGWAGGPVTRGVQGTPWRSPGTGGWHEVGARSWWKGCLHFPRNRRSSCAVGFFILLAS